MQPTFTCYSMPLFYACVERYSLCAQKYIKSEMVVEKRGALASPPPPMITLTRRCVSRKREIIWASEVVSHLSVVYNQSRSKGPLFHQGTQQTIINPFGPGVHNGRKEHLPMTIHKQWPIRCWPHHMCYKARTGTLHFQLRTGGPDK